MKYLITGKFSVTRQELIDFLSGGYTTAISEDNTITFREMGYNND